MSIRRTFPSFLTGLVVCLTAVGVTRAADLPASIERLREGLRAKYDEEDFDRMLTFVHPQAVLIFPGGQTVEGTDALREFHAKMLAGPNPVMKSWTMDPQVLGHSIDEEFAMIHGQLNDRCVLASGEELELNSRFTATLVKRPDGPVDTDPWVIRTFHASTDAFDNPLLRMTAKRTMWAAGGVSLAIGTIGGLLVGGLLRKRGTGRGASTGA